MRVETIEIHVGRADFEYEPLRQLEAKCEAPTAMSKAPSMDDVNAKLRELAASIGANAVVDVHYDSGVSMTSWRSIKATGLAVRRISDEITCPVCAETIKRAALKCRFCGAEIPKSAEPASAPAPSSLFGSPAMAPPLKSTDNPRIWIWAVAAVVILPMLMQMCAS